jgi:phosphinothricin acetyltransferase
MDAPLSIQPCAPGDIAAVADIYAHHVLHGVATFETDPPAPTEMQRRHDHVTTRGLPWVVAAMQSQIVGYAYAAPFRDRAAYRYTVEDSVYLHPQFVGRGIGRMLLAKVIADCEAAGLRQMLAVIGDSGNERSIRLHQSLGFVRAGLLTAVGYKHQRWVDVVMMQRPLRPASAAGQSSPLL